MTSTTPTRTVTIRHADTFHGAHVAVRVFDVLVDGRPVGIVAATRNHQERTTRWAAYANGKILKVVRTRSHRGGQDAVLAVLHALEVAS